MNACGQFRAGSVINLGTSVMFIAVGSERPMALL